MAGFTGLGFPVEGPASVNRHIEPFQSQSQGGTLGKAEAKEGPMTVLIDMDTNKQFCRGYPAQSKSCDGKGRLRTPSDQQTTSEAGSA